MSNSPTHRVGLLLALVLSLGPGTGLQVVAWVGMVIDRAPAEGFGSAVVSVLTGERPCRVCSVVRSLEVQDTGVVKLPPAPHLFTGTIMPVPVRVMIVVPPLAFPEPRRWHPREDAAPEPPPPRNS
jgi:hypothetical protein